MWKPPYTPPSDLMLTLPDGSKVTPEDERLKTAEEWARRYKETIGELLDYIDWLEHHGRR